MTLPKDMPVLDICQKCGGPKNTTGQGRSICDPCLAANPWFARSAHGELQPLDEPLPVEAPPRVDGNYRQSKWDAVLSRLVEHPGQWFVVAQTAGAGTPDYLRELAARRHITLEMVTRRGGPKRHSTLRIYARAIAQ